MLKKLIQNIHTVFAALGLAVLMPVATLAAFTSKQVVTNTATANVTGGGSLSMTATIKQLVNGAIDPTKQVNWLSVTLPQSFKMADDYIQLDSTITLAGGGIQIYTDNVNSTPPFTGVISSTTPLPAGLVDVKNSSFTIPVAWSIKSSTQLASAVAPLAVDPNSCPVISTSCVWLFMEDHSQVAVPDLNASAFMNADPFVTVQAAEQGIHFAQGLNQFGPAPSPYYIYLEANFGAAVAPATYKTTTLTLEAFTQ